MGAHVYNQGVGNAFFLGDATSNVEISFSNWTDTTYIRLDFTSAEYSSLLTGASTVNLDLVDSESYECGNCVPTRNITAGSLTLEGAPVPEPMSAGLFASGIGLIGLVRGKRRRT